MSSAVTEKGGYSHLAWLLGDLFFTMYRAWCCCAGLCRRIGNEKKINTVDKTTSLGSGHGTLNYARATLVGLLLGSMVLGSTLGLSQPQVSSVNGGCKKGESPMGPGRACIGVGATQDQTVTTECAPGSVSDNSRVCVDKPAIKTCATVYEGCMAGTMIKNDPRCRKENGDLLKSSEDLEKAKQYYIKCKKNKINNNNTTTEGCKVEFDRKETSMMWYTFKLDDVQKCIRRSQAACLAAKVDCNKATEDQTTKP